MEYRVSRTWADDTIHPCRCIIARVIARPFGRTAILCLLGGRTPSCCQCAGRRWHGCCGALAKPLWQPLGFLAMVDACCGVCPI